MSAVMSRDLDGPAPVPAAGDEGLHDRRWSAVLKVLGGLPTPQLKQALLLCHNLALQLSDDGRPQRLLMRPWDLPLFDLAAGLLNDWGTGQTAAREEFEAGLHVATCLDLLAVATADSRCDPHSFIDDAYAPLEQALRALAHAQWARLLPPDSPFWADHREAHEAALATRANPTAEPPVPPGAGLWALAPLPLMAAACWAGRSASRPALREWVTACQAFLQTVGHLAGFRRDLTNGVVTPTIDAALAAMGVTGRRGVRVETALAAMLLTGTLERQLQAHERRLGVARRLADDQRCASLAARTDALLALMQPLRASVGLRCAPGVAAAPLAGFFVPAPEVLNNVVLKAEAYLLDDLDFREAWDIQQHSWASSQRIVGRFFTASMAVEILAEHGHPMAAPVKGLLETLQSQGFRYWDHVHLIAPDIDDLAFALRLVRHARHPERYRAALEAPLRWVRENQLPSGRIPVWLRINDSPPALSSAAVLYGTQCAAVEANLMTSLIDSDWPRHRAVVEACARHWCRRWLDVGLGACEHYTPLYSLWAATELLARLDAHSHNEALRAVLPLVVQRVHNRLRQEAERSDLSPQDAAFLMLASLRHQALASDPAWPTVLFKHQRHDGCWEGEPIYVTPGARALSTQWFKSRIVTTAFIYHALKHHQAALLRTGAR